MKIRTSITIDEDVKRVMQDYAAQHNMNLSQLIEEALLAQLNISRLDIKKQANK